VTTDGGRALGFLPTGIARLAAELMLPVPPELAARVREVALSPPEGPEAQMELIATVAELRALAEAATRSGGDGDRALWRAAGSLGLLLDDDAEAIATLERMAELLAAEPPGGVAPDPEDRAVAAWCLATVAVAHRTRGRTVDATAAVRRTRDRVDADLAAGTIPPEDAVRIATVLAFGAADPTRARGAVRRLERDAIRLLGPGAPAVVEARDLHGELMVAAGEHRAAVRHYRALADDLAATRGDDDRLTVMARSSLLFARSRAGEDPRTVAREYRALVEAAEAAAPVGTGEGADAGRGPDVSDLRALRLNLIQMLLDVGEVAAARPRIDAAVEEVRAELAGEPDGAPDALLRGVGAQGLRVVDRLIMLLVLRYESLDGDVQRDDRDAIRTAAATALELHELCERHGDAPMLSRNTALRLALMTLRRAGRDEEFATVLRRSLDGRAERYGDGSEPHVAAMAIAAYLAGRGGGEDRSSDAATMALSLLDAGGDPEAERHRRVLELLRDRKPVRLVDHGL